METASSQSSLSSPSMLTTNQKDYAYAMGIGIVMLLGLIYITTFISIWIGIKPGAPALLLSITLDYYFLRGISKDKVFNIKFGLIAPILFFAFSGLLSNSILDSSYDGLAYHQTAVLNLMSGWNPLENDLPGLIWVNSYPKASWEVGATLANIFGSVEAMKAQNIISIIAAYLLTYSVIRRFFSGIRFSHALFISLAVAANPVALYQSFTGYNDGLLGSQITCLVALLILSNSINGKSALVGLIILIPFILNIKFTAVPYVGMLCFSYMVYLVTTQRWVVARYACLAITISIASGIIIFGANPYLFNTIQHGHPFYPVMGIGKVDIMSMNLPIALREHGYLFKLFSGLFSAPISWINGELFFFFPIFPHPYYFKVFTAADIRVGGFGPLFGLVICLVFAGSLINRKLSHSQKLLISIGIIIIITGLINPESWWARYVPQLWLGISCIAMSMIISTSVLKSRIGYIAFALMIVNSIGVEGVSLASTISKNYFWRESLQKISDEAIKNSTLYVYQGDHLATWARLDRFHIKYSIVSTKLDCKIISPLLPKPRSYLSDAQICSH